MKRYFKLGFIAAVILVGMSSCKKNNLVVDKDPVVTPPPFAEFLYSTFAKSYYLKAVGTTPFAIPVGMTSVGSVDRTIQFSYTSPTGAVMGTHFNAPSSLILKAGMVLDSLKVTGIYAPYSMGRVDSVKVKITSGSVGAFAGKDSVWLVMQRYCDVVLGDLSGDYLQTNEYNSAGAFQYGPYTTSLTNLVLVPGSTTKASGKIVNLYDDGWNDINCEIDWTSASNFKVTIPLQATGKAYGGAPATSVRTSATRASTFSSCDRSIVLNIDLVNAATGAATTANYRIDLK